jgi:hypothetical protein
MHGQFFRTFATQIDLNKSVAGIEKLLQSWELPNRQLAYFEAPKPG